jgi:hypothetical protein
VDEARCGRGDIEQHLQQSLHCYRELTVRRFHPHDDLGGTLGLLNFDRERIRRLIDRGFTDAVYHDCRVCGCVLAGLEEPAERREMVHEHNQMERHKSSVLHRGS